MTKALDPQAVTKGRRGAVARYASTSLTVLGLALLAIVVWRTGPRKIAEHVVLFGPWFPVILLVSSTWFLFNTAAWRIAFESKGGRRPVGYITLLRVHLICEAISNVTPFLSLGGEPVKVLLLRRWTSTEELAASVINDNVVHVASAVVFMFCGVLYGQCFLALDPTLMRVFWAGVGITAMGTLVLIVGSCSGMLGRITGVAASARPSWKRLESLRESARKVDEHLSRFVLRRPGTFAASLALHVSGRVMGALEAWVILKAAGVVIPFGEAVFLFAVLHVMVNLVFNFVTGQYGVQETAATLLFAALGLDPTLAVAMMLARRIRGFFWIGVGLALPGRRGTAWSTT